MERESRNAATDRTSAPGQYYGYSLQTTRLLARLLKCGQGDAVSVEVLDDVAVLGPGGTIAEQDKSGLAHNPIANRSVDLWKTLFNWVEAIRSGAFETNTRFILYVAQKYEGKFATLIAGADSASKAGAVLSELKDELWGKPPDYSRKEDLAEGLASYVNGVLEAEAKIVERLFIAFELEIGTGSPAEGIRSELRKVVREKAVDDVLHQLLGWVKLQVDAAIEQKRSPVIPYESFLKQLLAAARKFDRSDVLSPTCGDVTQEDVDRELEGRTYITQLKMIDLDDRDCQRAVNDFLRASADRSTWGERGDVLEDSLGEYVDRLQRHWDARRRMASLEMVGRTEVDIGRRVHLDCMDHEVRLQGMEVPSYFTPGSYHSLADELDIGWHPNYETLLRAQTDNEERSDSRPADEMDEGEG